MDLSQFGEVQVVVGRDRHGAQAAKQVPAQHALAGGCRAAVAVVNRRIHALRSPCNFSKAEAIALPATGALSWLWWFWWFC